MIAQRFGQGPPPLTLGVEEDFVILDAATLDQVGAVDKIVGRLEGRELPGRAKSELHASVFELNTNPECERCRGARVARRVAAAAAGVAGLSFRIAAIRETFEESGILLARPRGSKALVDAKRASEIEKAHRADLCDGKTTFQKVLKDHGMVLALDELVPYAHWITPEGMPKRFDTWFFLAAAPPEQVGAHDGKESTDSIWVSPREALEGGESGRFKLPFPTTRKLIRLGKQVAGPQREHAVVADRQDVGRARAVGARVPAGDPALPRVERAVGGEVQRRVAALIGAVPQT